MAPTILQWVETSRTERIARVREYHLQCALMVIRQIIDDYTLTLPADAIIAGLADVCLMEPFKTVLVNMPDDPELTRAYFTDAASQLPRLHDEWVSDAKAYLLRHTDLAPGSEAASARLDLAITQFRCSQCPDSHALSPAEVFTHSHEDTTRITAVSEQDEFLLRAFKGLRIQPWKDDNLGRPNWVHDPRLEQCVRDVVVACGRDADVTTLAEMTALDPWVQCKPCTARTPPHDQRVMSWRSAVRIPCSLGSPSWISRV